MLEMVIEQEMADLDIPGVAVAYIEDGEVLYSNGFGVRGSDDSEPVDADTMFAIGSVSKSMTANVLLSALADDDEHSLDTPLVDLLPELAVPPEETLPLMTLETTLNHTTTFPSLWDVYVTGKDQDKPSSALVTEIIPELVENGHNQWTEPGHAYWYSNIGYGLAGLGIEAITGQSFADALQERLTTPLGMSRTFVESEAVMEAGNYARGEENIVPINPERMDVPWARPAGLVWSSANDMGSYLEYLIDGNPDVLSDDDLRAMQSPQVDTGFCGNFASYGYGVGLASGIWPYWAGWGYHDTPQIFHTGSVPGFYTVIQVLPEHRTGYVLMWNSRDAWLNATEAHIFRHLFPLSEGTEAPDQSGDPDDWARWSGTYFDPLRFGTAVLDVHGSELNVKLLDAPEVAVETVTPICRNYFVLETSDGEQYEAKLLEDPDGNPNMIEIVGGGVFHRVEGL